MTPLAAVLALLVGLSLGLLGGGGSILTVPILTWVLHIPAKSAIAMSLPVVGGTSLVGAIGHWRQGQVHLRTALVFGLVTMAGAWAGARLAVFLSGAFQLLLLAVVMLAAAGSMLRPRRGEPPVAGPVAPGRPALLAVGVGVGLLTGVVGIGGGFLIVPALVVLGRIPVHQAIGTSLLVITMNAAAGAAGYVGQATIDWPLVAGFLAAAVVGVLAGTRRAPRVPAAALRRGFGVFLLVVGALLLVQQRHALTSPAAASAPAVDR
ncbi:MAG TPA: sulfite exporter TauE/SafE family protein [Gemmatimonadales bacterium]|nr:sulfite exporter TauE/SafE family protein [Gemmatimonadales bacterium]